MMAISYAPSPGRGKVFLKQYQFAVTLGRLVPRLRRVSAELSRRVQHGKPRTMPCGWIDAFEETWGGRTYFAATSSCERPRPGDHCWRRAGNTQAHEVAPTRILPSGEDVTWAKCSWPASPLIHESKIIHADLNRATLS